MRELKVIGLDSGGHNVVLQDSATDERFTVPADDSLRAAARGDIARLGQLEIETTGQLRPREIQSKIRAGASVAEIAQLSGLPASRVERFAHPVLLERSNAAHLGTKAHPLRADGPTVRTLGEVIAAAFGARGLDPETGTWDAWRPDGGEWVIQLSWLAGRSENSAHWSLHRDAHGGTVTPLDDAAAELIDPNFTRSLRPITQLDPAISPVDQVLVTPTTDILLETPVTASFERTPAPTAEADAESSGDAAAGHSPTTASRAQEAPRTSHAIPVSADEPLPEEDDAELPSPASAQTTPAATDPALRRSAERGKKGRKNKPTMPSWEDVLLGVRSNING